MVTVTLWIIFLLFRTFQRKNRTKQRWANGFISEPICVLVPVRVYLRVRVNIKSKTVDAIVMFFIYIICVCSTLCVGILQILYGGKRQYC